MLSSFAARPAHVSTASPPNPATCQQESADSGQHRDATELVRKSTASRPISENPDWAE
jgi:hypothetical protein